MKVRWFFFAVVFMWAGNGYAKVVHFDCEFMANKGKLNTNAISVDLDSKTVQVDEKIFSGQKVVISPTVVIAKSTELDGFKTETFQI
ncbi:hypothetical protein N8275_11725, partial [Pseudomonadales bacterium]|nr:hypothetical protein [Pseudomonadales bacterium]